MWPKPVYDTIVCFGDSLTQQAYRSGGFVSSLSDLFQRRLEVVNRGFSGYTSRQAIALCPTLFGLEKSSEGTLAKLGIVWFGTNDCIAPGFAQHVPVEEYELNMIKVLEYFDATDVLLVTPATVVPGKFAGHEDDKSMVEYGQALFRVAEHVAASRLVTKTKGKVEVLDMHAAFIDAAGKIEGGIASLMMEDGLHINETGYQVVFEAIKKAISIHFPNLDPTQLPFLINAWSDLDLSANQEGQRKQVQPKRD